VWFNSPSLLLFVPSKPLAVFTKLCIYAFALSKNSFEEGATDHHWLFRKISSFVVPTQEGEKGLDICQVLDDIIIIAWQLARAPASREHVTSIFRVWMTKASS